MRDRISSSKIALVRCDVHRTTGMRPIITTAISPVGDVSTDDALLCNTPGCDRHYRSDFGYYTATIGKRVDLALDVAPLRCPRHPETPCLFLGQAGPTNWRYDCPFDGCDYTEPCENRPKSDAPNAEDLGLGDQGQSGG